MRTFPTLLSTAALLVGALFTGISAVSTSTAQAADLPEDPMGEVVSFSRQNHDRLVWVTDMNMPYQAHGRGYLIDPDTGRFLSMLDLGYWTTGIELPSDGKRIISAETHFSRTTRGERSDVLVTYDATTFQVRSEVTIPAKRASVVKMQGTSSLSDDQSLFAQMNFTPAVSLTLVDLEREAFIAEIDTPGCPNIYGGGARSFHLLCGDGSFLTYTFDENGAVSGKSRSAALFDPFEDPVSISGVRRGDHWYFVSLAGDVYDFVMDADGVRLAATWPLITDDEREDEWSISGFQHLALHEPSGQLYLLTHQGPPETFEDPGTHVWVFDLETREKIEAYELQELTISIAVSQDDDPLLYGIGAHIPMPFFAQVWVYLTEGEAPLIDTVQFGLDIYDAGDGSYQRSVPKLGNLPSMIYPW